MEGDPRKGLTPDETPGLREQKAGIPGTIASAEARPRDARLVKLEDTPRSERGSWGFNSLTGHEDVLYILCFQHKTSCPKGKHEERPMVSDLTGVFTPRGAAAFRKRYAATRSFCSSPMDMGSTPVLDPHDQGSSMVEHWTVNPEEGAGRSSQKMPAR